MDILSRSKQTIDEKSLLYQRLSECSLLLAKASNGAMKLRSKLEDELIEARNKEAKCSS